LDVDWISEGLGSGAVGCLGQHNVGSFGGMECIPEQVFGPVGASLLKRKTSYLPVVPPHSATPFVNHLKSCISSRLAHASKLAKRCARRISINDWYARKLP